MAFQPAIVAAMMRMKQKDGDTTSNLLSMIKDSLHKWTQVFSVLSTPTAGSPHSQHPASLDGWWIKWLPEIEVLTSLLYYSVTTLNSLQTVGEEYVNILQVDGKSRKYMPKLFSRFAMIAMHCVGPYLFSKLCVMLKLYLNELEWIPESRKLFIQSYIDKSVLLLQWIYRLHRSLFFIAPKHDTIAKYLTQISYITISTSPLPDFPAFRVLGYIGLVQCLVQSISAFTHSYRDVQRARAAAGDIKVHQQSASQPSAHSTVKCPLCFDLFRNITTTPCGHLFCWECIYPWCCSQPICPVCRDKSPPKQLVRLVNFNI